MDEKELEEKYGNPNVEIVMVDGIPCILTDAIKLATQAQRNPKFPFSNLMDERKKYMKIINDEILKKRKLPDPIIPIDIFIIEFTIEEEDEDRGNAER